MIVFPLLAFSFLLVVWVVTSVARANQLHPFKSAIRWFRSRLPASLHDLRQFEKCMATKLTEIEAKLNAIADKVDKVKTEVQAVKDALDNVEIPPAAEAALARLTAAVEAVDVINPDAPTA